VVLKLDIDQTTRFSNMELRLSNSRRRYRTRFIATHLQPFAQREIEAPLRVTFMPWECAATNLVR